MTSESTQRFWPIGKEEPMELQVREDGTLEFQDGNVRIELGWRQVKLSREGDKEKFPLKRSSNATRVKPKLGRKLGRKATGVKVGVGMPYSVGAGNTLVNLTHSVWRILLKDGTYFVLPFSRVKELPDQVDDVIFVTDDYDVARQAQHDGRRDVFRPVLTPGSVTGPIVDERGKVVLIRALL